MEEKVISGHGKDSPGKRLSNLNLNGIDITHKKSNWRCDAKNNLVKNNAT